MTHLGPEDIEVAAGGQAFEHLSGCEACRQAVADARGRRALLKGMQRYTLSDMAFRRVEARLAEQVEQGASVSGPQWVWLLVPAALVAVVALFSPQATVAPGPDPRPAPVAVQLPKASMRPLVVLVASGDARVAQGEGWSPLKAGQVLTANEAVSAKALVTATEDSSWRLAVSGTMSLGGVAAATLGAGTLEAQVRGEALSVLAGARLAVAADAAYVLSRSAAETTLDVREGSVDVYDVASGARLSVRAPARLRWADGSPLDAGAVEPGAPVDAALLNLARPGPWGRLDLGALGAGTHLSIDGMSVGLLPLSLQWAVGRHKVAWNAPGQPSREAWVDLVAGTAVSLKLEPLPEPGAREPDPGALNRVMEDLRRQRPKLAACYEKWLKSSPTASGEVVLTLDVLANGKVRGAEVKGDPIPAASSACLVRTAKTLVLSPLGSAQALEVPLVLRPRH
jgi:hypothetical protein